MKQPDLKSIADDMLQLCEGKQEIIAAKRRNYYFVLIRINGIKYKHFTATEYEASIDF